MAASSWLRATRSSPELVVSQKKPRLS